MSSPKWDGYEIDKLHTETFFEIAPLAMFIVNRDRRLVRLNNAAAKLAGRTKKSSLGLRGGEFIGCISAFDNPQGCGYSNECESCIVRKTVMKTFETGQEYRSVEAAIRINTQNGFQERWILLSTALVDYDEGEEGVLICIKDITDRMRAEKAVQESEHKFRLVTETIENVFWMSTNGIDEMLYVSPAYDNLWKRSREILYRNPKAFIEAIHPEDRNSYLKIVDNYHKNGKPYRCEYRIVREDGTIRWICEKGFPVNNLYDERNLMSGVCNDITDLKRTEEALRMKNDELALKGRFAYLLLTSPDDEVFADVLDLLLQEFESQYGCFGYINKNGDMVCPSMTENIMAQCRIPEKSIVFAKKNWGGVWGKSLNDKVAIRKNRNLVFPSGHIQLNNTLVAPLVVDDDLVGQIALANKATDYTEKDQDKLVSIADFLAPILKIYLEKERAKKKLLLKAEKLKDRNIALKVLLENQEIEKQQQSKKMSQSFEKLVFPYFEKLKYCYDKVSRRDLLSIIESNILACLSPVEPSHTRCYRKLTPMEVQVADLIKSGKTGKEIAVILNISPRSVYFHRNNLRKKFNIHKSNINLRTFLRTHA